jgi:hypothetical protein
MQGLWSEILSQHLHEGTEGNHIILSGQPGSYQWFGMSTSQMQFHTVTTTSLCLVPVWKNPILCVQVLITVVWSGQSPALYHYHLEKMENATRNSKQLLDSNLIHPEYSKTHIWIVSTWKLKVAQASSFVEEYYLLDCDTKVCLQPASCLGHSLALKMEAVWSSETLMNFYRTTQVTSKTIVFFIITAVKSLNPASYFVYIKFNLH